MKKEKKDKHFIKKPVYPGGHSAMKEFIRSNLQYPPQALANKIEGVVRVRYTVNNKGEVVKTRVMVHLGYGCDEEAERLVRLLKFEVPKNRNLKPLFHKTVNIRFKLKEKPGLQLKYEISSETTPSSNYNYTITI